MANIKPASSNSVSLSFDRAEAGVLRDLIAQLKATLEQEEGADVIKGRLFPPAYESERDERSYRDLVGSDLHKMKLQALDGVAEALAGSGRAKVELTHEELEPWLTALTDLRLAMGTRLEVDEDKMSAELDSNDPDAPAMAVLHWLGWLQESILAAMTGRQQP